MVQYLILSTRSLNITSETNNDNRAIHISKLLCRAFRNDKNQEVQATVKATVAKI